jgi:hypothetical protein
MVPRWRSISARSRTPARQWGRRYHRVYPRQRRLRAAEHEALAFRLPVRPAPASWRFSRSSGTTSCAPAPGRNAGGKNVPTAPHFFIRALTGSLTFGIFSISMVAPEVAEAEFVSLEEADKEAEGAKPAAVEGDDLEVEDEPLDDAAFIVPEEEEEDDVTDIIGDGIEDDEENLMSDVRCQMTD